MRGLKTSRWMHSRPLSASPPRPGWNGQSSDRGDPTSTRPDIKKSRETGSREDWLMAYRALVDDLDDLARPRLDEHAPVIDDRVAIFAVARHRPEFDGWRQRFADDDALPHGHGWDALALDRGDHGVRDFQARADSRTNRAADDLAARAGHFATRPGAVDCAGRRGGLSQRRACRQQRCGNQRNGKTIVHHAL